MAGRGEVVRVMRGYGEGGRR